MAFIDNINNAYNEYINKQRRQIIKTDNAGSEGVVYTKSQIMNDLYQNSRDIQGNAIWSGAFNALDTERYSVQQKYNDSYREALTSAYDQYRRNQLAVDNSNLIASSRRDAYSESRNTLEEAYNSYMSGLSSATQAVDESYNSAYNSLYQALESQSQYMADYMNLYGSYYDELIALYGESLAENADWKTVYMGIDPDTEQERFKTWKELQSELYDSYGNLTALGVKVLDQLENDQFLRDKMTWGSYLLENNPELYEWANEANPYNYTFAGTNLGTIHAMTGRVSDDYEYSFLEHIGALSKEQIDDVFEPLLDLVSGTKSTRKNASKLSEELTTFATSLGMKDLLDDALKTLGFKNGITDMDAYFEGLANNDLSAGDTLGNIVHYAAFGGILDVTKYLADTPNRMQTSGGSVIDIKDAGKYLAKVIAPYITIPIMNAKQNKANAAQIKQTYTSIINALVLYANQQRTEANQEFTNTLL